MKRDSRGRFVKLEVKMDTGVLDKDADKEKETVAAPQAETVLPDKLSGSRSKKRGSVKKEEPASTNGAEGSTARSSEVPPTAEEFRVRAKGLAVQALERLGEIALDGESAAQHAIPAGKAIIEYAYGKAVADGGEAAGGIGRVDELLDSITEAAQEE